MNPYLQATGAVRGKPPVVPPGLLMRDRRTGDVANLPRVGYKPNHRLTASNAAFDDSGQLNAYDKKDALVQIKHILDNMADGTIDVAPSFEASASDPGFGMTAEEQHQIVLEALHDPSGAEFSMLGQQLVNPVKNVLDYDGFARRCLPVRLVRQGEVVRYDKDVFLVAYETALDAQTPESRFGGQYVYPTQRVVSALPSIVLSDVYQAGYDVVARAQDRARQAIELQEDRIFRGELDRVANMVNNIVFFSTANLATMEALRFEVEKNRLAADKFLINRQEVSDFTAVMSGEVDPVTQRELVMAGYVGMILNTMIITSAGRAPNNFEVIRPGEMFCVTSPEFLGGFPVWVELFSEPANQFQQGKPVRCWFWWELIAERVMNNAGVAKAIKS